MHDKNFHFLCFENSFHLEYFGASCVQLKDEGKQLQATPKDSQI